MRSKIFFLILLLLPVGVIFGGGGGVFRRTAPPDLAVRAAQAAPAYGHDGAHAAPGGERKVLYWYDPMYPDRRFDKPGKSPFMDMDLVPRYAEDGAGAGIRIDPAQTQNMAVRTEKVKRGRLVFTRDIPADVEFNAYRLARVQPRADGFVEKTYDLAVGDTVEAGQALVEITVPAWAADQSEYLLLRSQRAAPEIVRGVRERLRLSGMPEEMLKIVDQTGRVQTGLTVKAPLGGVVTALDVYPGMNVDKSMTLATIQGTNPAWVTADVPERDIHLVGGGRIRVAIPAYPDRAFFAESATLLPKADPATRTVPLRLTLNNAEGLLKPGLTASIRLRGESDASLLIPTQSLIDLGGEQRVVVRAADGAFVPKRVRVLRSSRNETAVLGGLEEGEDVVVSGLFLIDSEANLRGALDRMRATDGEAE
ncbi:MAG: efflux RND transporter periplasmic adaptor subunit [Desulfovibrio sp.]|jgi:Cu(I)/Ag(I) efflux system membrane fusion protein|nr:efflux RND transporter periplasmic adaptor subunit [Desulfovibrio sp.]